MTTRENETQVGLSSEAEAKPFRMISIYDSPTSSRNAARASELVLRELGEGVLVDKTMWDVRSFEKSRLRSMAADEAAQADVIVIALGTEDPGESFKAWIDLWLKSREMKGGLIALIPSGQARMGGDLAQYLYETAVSADMDFLCQKQRRHQ